MYAGSFAGVSCIPEKRSQSHILQLSLLRVYQAITETEQVHVFDLHQNPNDKCIVGRHIRPVLTDVFRGIEEKAEQELKNTTLADCMERMRKEIDKE